MTPEVEKALELLLASVTQSEEALKNGQKLVRSIYLSKWDLLSAPLMRRLVEAERVTKRARHQVEQLLYGGDPYMTGLPEGEERLEKQREIHKSGRY